MQYWLMKSEPEVFSMDDLSKVPREPWDGVRNYQARNFMKSMKKGDLAFFYHSNCKPPGIAGLMTIAKTAYPDYTAWDPNSPYFDEKSSEENPRWFMVDVKYKKRFKELITLDELKQEKKLADLPLVRKGNRLSIMPVTAQQWDYILSLSSFLPPKPS
ncbi:MAG: EVE domain-containing protein [Oligoflexales bacterium]|nr:EVE domain-containing protein [Oligoflexales bacterium]